MNTRAPIKIFITGDPAAGKSTAAVALKEQLNLPVFHADTFLYENYSTKLPEENFRRELDSFITANSGYIVDGCTFGEGTAVFDKLVSDADIIINFDISPQKSINSFFNRVDKSIKSGNEPIGMKLDNWNMDKFKIWLGWYSDYLNNKKDMRKQKLDEVAQKVITLQDYADTEKILVDLDCRNLIKKH